MESHVYEKSRKIIKDGLKELKKVCISEFGEECSHKDCPYRDICDIIGIVKNKRTPKQWEFDEEKITVGELRRWNGIDIFGVFEVLKDLGKIGDTHWFAIRNIKNDVVTTSTKKILLNTSTIVETGFLVTDEKLNELISRDDWVSISKYKTLSEDFIREFKDKVDWKWISIYQTLSEDFIREFQDKVNWFWISCEQTLSEDFIREFQDKVNWEGISKKQILSESFIKEFKDKVNWFCISMYQTLSESFIREFKDKVDWYCISRYQTLSEDFIREFKDKLL